MCVKVKSVRKRRGISRCGIGAETAENIGPRRMEVSNRLQEFVVCLSGKITLSLTD